MAYIKVNSKLKALIEAIRQHLTRPRVRPEVLRHLEDSIAVNERLGRLLAK